MSDLMLAVLCGGKSARMGRPKALLEFEGQPLLVRALDRLADACPGKRCVVAAPGQELPALPSDVNVLRDRAPNRGPLEGVFLATQLAAQVSDESSIAIVSCDAPFLNPDLVVAMNLQLQTDEDAAVVQGAHRRYPLPGVYRGRVSRTAGELIESGEGSLQALLDCIQSNELDEGFARRFDRDLKSLVNVNTPAELERALQRTDRHHHP